MRVRIQYPATVMMESFVDIPDTSDPQGYLEEHMGEHVDEAVENAALLCELSNHVRTDWEIMP